MKNPRKFFITKGLHYGSKLHTFESLRHLEKYHENKNRDFKLYRVIEKSAYDKSGWGFKGDKIYA